MRRFFIEPTAVAKGTAIIAGQEARHMSLTLRMQHGNRLELFDGSGRLFLAEITSIGKTEVLCKIISSTIIKEKPPYLFLAQSIIKGKKMDLVVQKATELGVNGLHPVITQRCTIRKTTANQLSRWQRIAHESCKQCGRTIPMQCHTPAKLTEFLGSCAGFERRIILWEKETEQDLNIASSKDRTVILLIGPEGGFSRKEVELAISYGFTPASLGSLTLRAETASVAATSIVQHQLGNLSKNQKIAWEGCR